MRYYQELFSLIASQKEGAYNEGDYKVHGGPTYRGFCCTCRLYSQLYTSYALVYYKQRMNEQD